MPQLDKLSFFSQVFWFLIVFFALYYFTIRRWLPSIYLVARVRKNFRELASGDKLRYMRVFSRLYDLPEWWRWQLRSPRQKFTYGFYSEGEAVDVGEKLQGVQARFKRFGAEVDLQAASVLDLQGYNKSVVFGLDLTMTEVPESLSGVVGIQDKAQVVPFVYDTFCAFYQRQLGASIEGVVFEVDGPVAVDVYLNGLVRP